MELSLLERLGSSFNKSARWLALSEILRPRNCCQNRSSVRDRVRADFHKNVRNDVTTLQTFLLGNPRYLPGGKFALIRVQVIGAIELGDVRNLVVTDRVFRYLPDNIPYLPLNIPTPALPDRGCASSR